MGALSDQWGSGAHGGVTTVKLHRQRKNVDQWHLGLLGWLPLPPWFFPFVKSIPCGKDWSKFSHFSSVQWGLCKGVTYGIQEGIESPADILITCREDGHPGGIPPLLIWSCVCSTEGGQHWILRALTILASDWPLSVIPGHQRDACPSVAWTL